MPFILISAVYLILSLIPCFFKRFNDFRYLLFADDTKITVPLNLLKIEIYYGLALILDDVGAMLCATRGYYSPDLTFYSRNTHILTYEYKLCQSAVMRTDSKPASVSAFQTSLP
jgi:hypothetical protein